MASPFYIQSKLLSEPALVIDIRGAGTTPKTPLNVSLKTSTIQDRNSQLWTFVQAPEINYWFLRNPTTERVVDVTGDPDAHTTPGTLLDADTLNFDYNQVWTFIPSEVEQYFFIQSALSYIPSTPKPDYLSLVIDVQGNSTQPNTALDVYTQKKSSPDWDNQLWTFIDESNHFVPPPPLVVGPPHKIKP
jgi:hypothetical protein